MLTITRNPLSLKAVAFGTVAFVIGLTGAATYVQRYRAHENLVFGKEQTAPTATTAKSTPDKSTPSKPQDTASSQKTTSPQPATDVLGSAITSPTAGASARTAPLAATGSSSAISPQPVGGMGGGTSSTTTAPTTSTSGSSTTVTPGNTSGPTVLVNPPDVCLVGTCVITPPVDP